MEVILVTVTVCFPRLFPRWHNAVFLRGLHSSVQLSLWERAPSPGNEWGWEDSGSTLGNMLSCFWVLRAMRVATGGVRRVWSWGTGRNRDPLRHRWVEKDAGI